MDEKVNLSEDNYVVKANQLIEAKGRLGALEQKLFAALISEIQPNDEDFKDYYLKVSDISELLGNKSNTIYERLKEASDNLMNKSIKLENINEKGKRNFIITRLISSAQYQEGDGAIIIRFDPVLKPYLVAINGKETPFTKYLISNILKLDNSYSIRLYEILKQCEKMKNREIKTDELKDMLGVDSPSYNLFSEFERKVLKVAKSEINEKTDIWVDYKKIKEGRSITKIKFSIETKMTKELLEQEKEKEFVDFYNNDEKFEDDKTQCGLENIAISKVDFYKLLDIAVDNQQEHAFEYMALTAEYVIERKPKHFIAYFGNALKNNYIKF